METQPQREMEISNYALNSLKLVFDENGLNEIGKDKLIKILFQELSKYRKINSQDITKVNLKAISEPLNSGAQSLVLSANDIKNPDTHSEIKDLIDKDYNKELNNKRLMALSGMNPYG